MEMDDSDYAAKGAEAGAILTIGWITLSSFLIIYSFILCITLVNTGDTSIMKYLLLVYSILQIVSFIVCYTCLINWTCNILVSRFNFDKREYARKRGVIIERKDSIYCKISFISMVILSIFSIICIISSIVIAGYISSLVLVYSWTNVFIDQYIMITFVIIILIVLGMQSIIIIIIVIFIGICIICGSIICSIILYDKYENIDNNNNDNAENIDNNNNNQGN